MTAPTPMCPSDHVATLRSPLASAGSISLSVLFPSRAYLQSVLQLHSMIHVLDVSFPTRCLASSRFLDLSLHATLAKPIIIVSTALASTCFVTFPCFIKFQQLLLLPLISLFVDHCSDLITFPSGHLPRSTCRITFAHIERHPGTTRSCTFAYFQHLQTQQLQVLNPPLPLHISTLLPFFAVSGSLDDPHKCKQKGC